MRATSFGVRGVTIRMAMVLGRKGALPSCCRLSGWDWEAGLDRGNQWMPWNPRRGRGKPVSTCGTRRITGRASQWAFAVPGSKPRILPRILGSTLRAANILAVPSFILRTVLQDQASLLLERQRALPKRALETGFRFRFPYLEDALQNLLKERRPP